MFAPNTHRNLVAWQEGMKLVEMVYHETRHFPKEELFGIVSQVRRSAVSIPSNLAEGAGRNSSRELMQFVGIASGSVAELSTQLELSVRLGFMSPRSEALKQVALVGKLINGLRKSIKNRGPLIINH